MAEAIVSLFAGLTDTIYLHGSAQVAYSGSGTPWTVSSTTPFQIANNDITGPRFVLTAPPHTPVQAGGGLFSPWATSLAMTSANRTIVVPVQAMATTDANLMVLINVLRRYLFDVIQRSGGLSFIVLYAGKTVQMRVENAVFQETMHFWNDEAGNLLLRGTLTLECRIGTASAGVTLGSSTTITNAVANTSLLAGIEGDWRYLGQPLEIELSGGDLATTGTKLVYCAITRTTARNNSSFAETLNTSSTSGATAAGTITIALPTRKATTIRMLAYITSPSSNLEVRPVLRYDTTAGQAIYTGPTWIAPGTSNMLIDLGFVKPAYLDTGMTLLLQLQYRSTNGSATSGALVYLYLLEYYTFCAVTPPLSTGTNERIIIASPSPGIDAVSPNLINPLPHPGFASVEASSIKRQDCAVAGEYPVAIRDAGIFLAWIDGGVFNPSDTISLASYQIPLYETVADT